MHELLKNAQAVIFDMDGVLVDTEPIHVLIERQIFDELGISVSDELHHSFIGRSSKEMWAEIIKIYNLHTTVAELVELKRSKYITHLEGLPEMPLMPGVLSILEQLAAEGKNLALASSSGMPNIRYIIAGANIEHYFRAVISGADLPRSKPDPAVFIVAAEKLGVEPSACVVIEDAYAGVLAAKAAGMVCIGHKGTGEYPQDLSGADCLISHFDELL